MPIAKKIESVNSSPTHQVKDPNLIKLVLRILSILFHRSKGALVTMVDKCFHPCVNLRSIIVQINEINRRTNCCI